MYRSTVRKVTAALLLGAAFLGWGHGTQVRHLLFHAPTALVSHHIVDGGGPDFPPTPK